MPHRFPFRFSGPLLSPVFEKVLDLPTERCCEDGVCIDKRQPHVFGQALASRAFAGAHVAYDEDAAFGHAPKLRPELPKRHPKSTLTDKMSVNGEFQPVGTVFALGIASDLSDSTTQHHDLWNNTHLP